MSFRICRIVVAIAGIVALAACVKSDKSADPLSPAVAGPIAGVNISSPRLLQPGVGARIAVNQQPITLTIANATTSGVRPLNYLFEIATDTGFSSTVFSQTNINPGANGQTSVTLADQLQTGQTYFWRSRAQDGANTGPYSTPGNFSVYTPVVFQAPALVAPINNVTVSSLQPTFTFTDAAHTGPVGPIIYTIEASNTSDFAVKASQDVAEQPGQTSLTAPQSLPAATQVFWHVRAYDPTTVGPWSATAVFQTPAAAAPPPPPPGGGGGGGNAADQLDMTQVSIYNSPPDIASWPVTTNITSLTMQPLGSACEGLAFTFPAQNTWPDVIPPGFGGPIQYTVWAMAKVNGQWAASGFVLMWRGRPCTGSPILTEFAQNWAYDSRWGPLDGYQPHVGEQMGFMVSAGDARGILGVSSVRERSNVVLVPLPAGDSGVFTFSILPRLRLR